MVFFALIVIEENCVNSYVVGKENVMNGEVIINGENGIVVIDSVDGVFDVFEKIRRVSDFYCFYYGEFLEDILIINDVIKLRGKLFVFFKFKIRRGSVFFLSFNYIDRVFIENKDVIKRFFYNES